MYQSTCLFSMGLRKRIFKVLVGVNKLILPSLVHKDPGQLNKIQKAILGWRYWTLINSL
uniref:SsrA-binding protein n=3 Tax=Sphingobacteriaceae TaxID=84566 RepID=F4CEX5_SPHS2